MSQDTPDFSTVNVLSGYDEPPADAYETYHSGEIWLNGVRYDVRIIGSSHYISADAEGSLTTPSVENSYGDHYHEMLSCYDVPDVYTSQYDITGALDTELHAGSLSFPTVELHSFPLSAFPSERTFDVAYKFDEKAWTTVDATGDGWETWPTYPELGVALYTETVFNV